MTDLHIHEAAHTLTTPDAFFVLWQDPQSRSFHHVGDLSRVGSSYHFTYSPQAPDVLGFTGLAEFPDWDAEYTAASLFPTFANRVMSTRRDDYTAYLSSLGIDSSTPEPFELLARTLGSSPADHLHVIPQPVNSPNGAVSLQFPAHGCRHVDPESVRLREIAQGDQLYLAREPVNTFNRLAVLIGREQGADRGHAVGYVPDVLAPVISHLLETDAPLVAAAAHVWLADPARPLQPARLLVRVDALPLSELNWQDLLRASA